MRIPSTLTRLLLVSFASLALAAPPACSGSGEPALPLPPDGAALRAAFPEQAPRVLESGAPFTASAAGFAQATPSAALTVELPRDASAPVRLRLASGRAVLVREDGLTGEGVIAEGAVAYRRAGGTSFWTAARHHAEEWLQLDAGAARSGEVVASWEVLGATLQERDGAVDLLDEASAVIMVVTAPAAFAAGGRAVPARIAARGAHLDLRVDAGGEAVLVDPMWTQVGSLSSGRTQGAAVLLPSGYALVTGGNFSKVTDLYNASTNLFSQSGSMAASRVALTATLLPDGTVLAVGGGFLNTFPDTAEIYSSATSMWTATVGPPSTVRIDHTATLLPTGKVLITGGYTPNTTDSALNNSELYDPASGTFSATGGLSVARGDHTATLLPNGKVLVAGGHTPGATALVATPTAEIYDPALGTFTQVASMSANRWAPTATLLPSGKVLVSGGEDTMPLATAEIYDPTADTWTATGTMSYGRYEHTATLLGSGSVLVVGGAGLNAPLPGNTSEIWSPSNGMWTFAGSTVTSHVQATATLLADGTVLIAGGHTQISETWDPETPNGGPCTVGAECLSGFCVDDVCCSTACTGGVCNACSVAAGGQINGICYPLTGTPCDDGDACTVGDMCNAGTCMPGSPAQCPATDQCHAQGSCAPQTGMCSNPKLPEGTACTDGNACTQGDACMGGLCVPGPAVVCAPPDGCHTAGTCNMTTGTCSYPPKSDGTLCDDGDPCTQSDICMSGVCVGTKPVMCTPGPCDVSSTCDPSTGTCQAIKSTDGAPCVSGDPCTMGDTCTAGVCQPGSPVTCTPMDECHEAGSCLAGSGGCTNPDKPDGAPCSLGSCIAGKCTAADAGRGETGGGGGSSSSGTGGSVVGDKAGCGCEVEGSGGGTGTGLGGALALLAVAAARRRRGARVRRA